MKRAFFFCGLVVALISSTLLAFGYQKAPGEKPTIVNLASMPAGMIIHAQAAGMAALISEHTSMKCKHMPKTNESVWLPMMVTREIDLGCSNTIDIWMAYMARPPYDELAKKSGAKSFPIRLLVRGDPLILSWIVRGDSGIYTFQDLKGKIVNNMEKANPGVHLINLGLLANAGMTYDDVRSMPFPGPAPAAKAVIEGRCDGALLAPFAPLAKVAIAAAKVRWLPLDDSPGAVKRMQDVFPGLYLVKDLKVKGVDLPRFLMAWDNCLSVREDLPEEAAYEIVKAMWEHNDELISKPLLARWKTNRFVSTKAVVPYHDGAIKFYKEMGVWSKEMEEHQKALLAQKP